MTTLTRRTATPPRGTTIDAQNLIREIEQYLATQTPRTAHRLVTKTTSELVAEALAGQSAPTAAPTLTPPSRLWRILPDWALSLTRQLHAGTTRHITVAEHLELTALVIQQHGWAKGSLRTPTGRICMLGAQYVLYRLGYGDERTAEEAGRHIQNVLAARGIQQRFPAWNDGAGRTQGEVLHLIREAATNARTTS